MRGAGPDRATRRCARIAAVGTLKPLKAYDTLLEALGLLAAKGKAFELSCAGDGPERADLEALARRLGIAGRVKFLGEISDAPALLATAHLLVHPSKSESMSNTIVEAMAEGLPVIAVAGGRQSGDRRRRASGLLVPPARPDLLADAVGRLLDDPALRRRLGEQGLRYVKDECSEFRVADAYESTIRGLVSLSCNKVNA